MERCQIGFVFFLCVIREYAAFELYIFPNNSINLLQGTSKDITVHLTYNSSAKEHLSFCWREHPVELFIHSSNRLVVRGPSEAVIFDLEQENNKSITLTARWLGYADLQFSVKIFNCFGNESETVVLEKIYTVIVTLANKKLDMAVHIVIVIMLVLLNITMGCQLDLNIIKNNLKKPLAPAIGFTCQFIFMPLVAFGIASALFDDHLKKLGLFVLGCCPGGSNSNFWTVLFRGDISLSITMTFISTLAATGMMPLWLFILGRYLTSMEEFVIPYVDIMVALVLLTIPALIGIFIANKKPQWVNIANKMIRPFSLIFILFVLSAGVYNYRYVFHLMGWREVVAGITVAASAYAFGAGMARLAGLTKPEIIAVSLETALQNGTIALVLMKLTFPEPDRELACIAPIAQLFLTGWPLWIIIVVRMAVGKVLKWRRKKKEKSKETAEMEPLGTAP